MSVCVYAIAAFRLVASSKQKSCGAGDHYEKVNQLVFAQICIVIFETISSNLRSCVLDPHLSGAVEKPKHVAIRSKRTSCYLDSDHDKQVYCTAAANTDNISEYAKWWYFPKGTLSSNGDIYINSMTGFRLDNDDDKEIIYMSNYVSERAQTKWKALSDDGCLENVSTGQTVGVGKLKNANTYEVTNDDCSDDNQWEM